MYLNHLYLFFFRNSALQFVSRFHAPQMLTVMKFGKNQENGTLAYLSFSYNYLKKGVYCSPVLKFTGGYKKTILCLNGYLLYCSPVLKVTGGLLDDFYSKISKLGKV